MTMVLNLTPPSSLTSIEKEDEECFALNEEVFQVGSASDWILVKKMALLLGERVLRFGPVCTEIQVPSAHKRRIFEYVKSQCMAHTFTDAQILRSVQKTGYHPQRSLRLLKRTDRRYMNITAQELESQLTTKTLFPLPGVYSDVVDDFFYMRPCRFTPGATPISAIISNLVYVMDSIYERHRNTNRKIGFIANMNDWRMENFSVDYCFQFMEVLQGRKGPNKVDMFLIVNPPVWFDSVWKIMQKMLSPSFCKKVHIIQEHELDRFLLPGFEQGLPDELQQGCASANELVADFVAFRMFVEAETRERCPSNSYNRLFYPSS